MWNTFEVILQQESATTEEPQSPSGLEDDGVLPSGSGTNTTGDPALIEARAEARTLRRQVPTKRKRGYSGGVDSINATLESTLSSVKGFFEKSTKAKENVGPNRHFSIAVEQMLDGIRNRRRRRRLQAEIMNKLAEATSDSEDST